MLKDKIVELRKANNDTQECLAKKLSVSRSLIAKWEQGRAVPNVSYMKKIYELYNVSYEQMIELDELLFHKKKDNNKYILSVGISELIFLTIISLIYIFLDKVFDISPTTILYCVTFLVFVTSVNFILLLNGKKYINHMDFSGKILIPILMTLFCCFIHFIVDICLNWIFYSADSLIEDMPWKVLFILIELFFLGILNVASFNSIKWIKKQ